jgi:hypothetical protein
MAFESVREIDVSDPRGHWPFVRSEGGDGGITPTRRGRR